MRCFLLACLLLTACGEATRTEPVAAPAPVSTAPVMASLRALRSINQPLRVAVIGNSIALGFRADAAGGLNDTLSPRLLPSGQLPPELRDQPLATGGWVDQLRAWLDRAWPGSVVTNHSGNGWTTADHVEAATAATVLAGPRPDLVLVPLHVGDYIKRLPVAAYAANLRAIAEPLAAAGLVVVLVSENVVWHRVDDARPVAERQAAYVAALQRVAQELAVDFPGLIGYRDAWNPTSDALVAGEPVLAGYHPAQYGHDLIFAAVTWDW